MKRVSGWKLVVGCFGQGVPHALTVVRGSRGYQGTRQANAAGLQRGGPWGGGHGMGRVSIAGKKIVP